MAYEVSWETNGVLVRYSGKVTFNQVLEAQSVYEQDERFDRLRYIIIDTLAVTDATSPPDHAEEVWVQDVGAATSNPRIRKAFIATLPEVIAFAETYRKLPRGAYELEIFSSEADARAWLGLKA